MNTRPSASRLITLTTDFGTADSYVGCMKGVMLAIDPNLSLVDIAHDLPSHQILPAAFLLRDVCPRFPDGTIHLAVIDPGVGGKRRPLVLEIGNHLYVGPDNGIFGLLLTDFGMTGAWEIDNRQYQTAKISRTFHGRDIFAPAAANLARGVSPASLGTPVGDPLRVDLPACSVGQERLRGEVLWVDSFGNCITNISGDMIKSWSRNEPFHIRVSSRTLHGVSDCYGSVPAGEALALLSSFGNLEIACNQGRADQMIGLGPGKPVCLERG